jgi:hypothetical protein
MVWSHRIWTRHTWGEKTSVADQPYRKRFGAESQRKPSSLSYYFECLQTSSSVKSSRFKIKQRGFPWCLSLTKRAHCVITWQIRDELLPDRHTESSLPTPPMWRTAADRCAPPGRPVVMRTLGDRELRAPGLWSLNHWVKATGAYVHFPDGISLV